jgi:hypothetical protein
VEPKERERLETLRQALRLDGERAIGIYAFQAQEVLQRRWADATADKRISDDEVKSLEDRARNLGATVKFDASASTQMDRFRSFWRMENGTYPEVETPINLHRGEKCHFSSAATWYQRRTVTKVRRHGRKLPNRERALLPLRKLSSSARYSRRDAVSQFWHDLYHQQADCLPWTTEERRYWVQQHRFLHSVCGRD